MRDIVPSTRYSSVCNVLRQWNISLIPTYRVYKDPTVSNNYKDPTVSNNYKDPTVSNNYRPIALVSNLAKF